VGLGGVVAAVVLPAGGGLLAAAGLGGGAGEAEGEVVDDGEGAAGAQAREQAGEVGGGVGEVVPAAEDRQVIEAARAGSAAAEPGRSAAGRPWRRGARAARAGGVGVEAEVAQGAGGEGGGEGVGVGGLAAAEVEQVAA
jgi:hypothetical protein